MTKGLLFWLVYIIVILLGGWYCFGYYDHRVLAGPIGVEMLLIGILGWGLYGPAVR